MRQQLRPPQGPGYQGQGQSPNAVCQRGNPGQHIPAVEDQGPIVGVVWILAAHQRQFMRPCIGHVAGNVEQVFGHPHQAEMVAEVLLLPVHFICAGAGYQQLHQCAAVDAQTAPKQAENRMAGFVEGKVGRIQYGHPAAYSVDKQNDSRPGKQWQYWKYGPHIYPLFTNRPGWHGWWRLLVGVGGALARSVGLPRRLRAPASPRLRPYE